MRNFFHKYDQVLLKKYPVIWNTKLIWAVLCSLVIHAFFFTLGFVYLIDPATLQTRNRIGSYFEDGLALVGMIISVLGIVIWLVAVFRNNSLKSFYPSSPLKLVKEFSCYFIIILLSTSFYYSFTLGMQSWISLTYDNEEVSKQIHTINKAIGFIPQKIYDYEIDKLIYPKPFDSLHVETDDFKMDSTSTIYRFKTEDYQFSTVKYTDYPSDSIIKPYLIERKAFNRHISDITINDSINRYFFKDKVVSVQLPAGTPEPSLYNYRKTYINTSIITASSDYNLFGLKTNDYENHSSPITWRNIDSYEYGLAQYRYEILKNNRKDEIIDAINALISVADAYRIEHNLDPENSSIWKNLEEPFFIKELIFDGDKPYNFKKPVEEYYKSSNYQGLHDYNKALYGNAYFDYDRLEKVFENIKSFKNKNIFVSSIHAYVWLAFVLAILIFCFRVTSIKGLILSIVTAGILVLLTILVTVTTYSALGSEISQYLVLYFLLFLGLLFITLAIGFMKQLSKRISGIVLSICIAGSVLWLFLILVIIETHQRDLCQETNSINGFKNCPTILDSVTLWSYVLLILGFASIYFWSKYVLRWRAKPDN